MTPLKTMPQHMWGALYALGAAVVLALVTETLATWVLLMLALVLLPLLLYVVSAGAVGRVNDTATPRQQRDVFAPAERTEMPIDILLPDGSVQAAQPVALESGEGCRLVMTAKGFQLVDRNQRVIHTFGEK